MPAFERCGWGAFADDLAPPIAQEAALLRCRELTLRLSIEALADAGLTPALVPHFVSRDGATLHGRLIRLLQLLRRLLDEELRALRDRIRYVSQERALLAACPEGGRLDVLATMRLALARHGSPAPPDTGPYVLCRNERLSDTPVNRLLASILRRTEDTLSRLLGREAGALYRGERSLFSVALRALRGFLQSSPLGSVPWAGEEPEDLLPLARHRQAELWRVRSLYAWWRSFRQEHLAALQTHAEGEVRALSPSACYELLCALGLLLCARERLALVESGADASSFHLPAGRGEEPGRLSIAFGVPPEPAGRYARPASAVLRIARAGKPERQVLVEARNFSEAAAREVAVRLESWCEARPRQRAAVLLTPVAVQGAEEGALRWRSFLGLDQLLGGAGADPIGAWRSLLDELLAPKEGERW